MSLLRQGSGGQGDDANETGLKLDSYLPYRLSVASNAVSGLIARAYEDRFGLTVPQWRLICVLAYEAALIAGLAPEDVTLLKRLLGRLQSAAGLLSGEATRP